MSQKTYCLGKQLKQLCEKEAQQYDKREFFKQNHAHANCVKMLLRISSQVIDGHKVFYNNIKYKKWFNWKSILKKDEFIKEVFPILKKCKNPKPGIFVFFRPKKTFIGHVGLFINDKEYYH